MILRFAGFELDDKRRELRRDAAAIHLEPQVFKVLLYLAKNRIRVVSRDELLEECWPGVVVNDDSLSLAIHQVRRIMRPFHVNPIRTVHRHGYRFVAEIETTGAPDNGTRLVGRSDIVQRLIELHEQATAGSGATALLEGPPGIGKSACAEAFMDWVRNRGGIVIDAWCRHDEGVPVLWPWIQVQRFLIQNRGASALRESLGSTYDYLSALLPENTDPTAGESMEPDPERNPFRLFDGFSRLLTASVLHERTRGNPFFAGALIRLLEGSDRHDTRNSLDELRDELPDSVKGAPFRLGLDSANDGAIAKND